MLNGFSLIIGSIGLLAIGLTLFILLTTNSRVILGLSICFWMLLLSPLIIPASYMLYGLYNRLIFSLQQDGTVVLSQSPFKIPTNSGVHYCEHFSTPTHQPIATVSKRDDGSYCGEFWQFYEQQHIVIPYKKINDLQAIYWASPQLKILGPLPHTQPLKLQYFEENSLKG